MKPMTKTFSLEPSIKNLTLLVVFLHLIIVGWMLWSFPSSTKPTPVRLRVQTIKLAPKEKIQPKTSPALPLEQETFPEKILEPPSVPESEKKALKEACPLKEEKREEKIPKIEEKQTPPPPKIEASKIEKKIPPKKIEAPKPAPTKAQKKPLAQAPAKPSPTPKKVEARPAAPPPKQPSQPNSKQKELLAKAQESLAKMDQSKAKIPPPLPEIASAEMPKALSALSIDNVVLDQIASLTSQESFYASEIIQRLKLYLKLPEHGETKLKLTLKRNGQVGKIVVIASKSRKNQEYLEKNLPQVPFPPFGENFGKAGEYTFSVTLEG